MTVGFIALTALMVTIIAVLWWGWVARDRAHRRALRAEASALALERITQGSAGVVHDVNNLLASAFLGTEAMLEGDASEEAARDAANEVGQGIQGAVALLAALQADLERKPLPTATTEGFVRLHVALLREQVEFDVEVTGDLEHHDHPLEAGRIVQNLIQNAAREARLAGGTVGIRLTDRALEVTNQVADPGLLSEQIYERGTSAHGSTGVGLSECKRLATMLGWSLTHEVRGKVVTFRIGLR